jgi:hypothetical protein
MNICSYSDIFYIKIELNTEHAIICIYSISYYIIHLLVLSINICLRQLNTCISCDVNYFIYFSAYRTLVVVHLWSIYTILL